MIAVPWYMSEIRGETTFYGVAYTIITGLTLFWSLYAGTLIDRYPRKRIFMGLNLAGLLIMSTIGITGLMQGSIPDLLVMLAFGATIFIFNVHYPSLYAFGQEITEPKHYGRTNSLFEIQGQTTTVLGGALAAVLLGGTAGEFPLKSVLPFEIEAWEIHEIFVLDAATYAVAFILISFIKYQPISARKVDLGSLKERFRTGLRFLSEHRPLFWFGVASYLIFVTLIVQSFYLMPTYVGSHLGEGAWLFATGEVIYAIGAILAGVFIRRIFKKMHAVRAVRWLMILSVLIYITMAITQDNWIFLGFCLLLGLANAGTRVLRITYLFNHVPNDLIGRTNSIFNAINITLRTIFLAMFAAPFFTSGSNITWAYLILGILIAIGLIPILRNQKKLLQADEKSAEED